MISERSLQVLHAIVSDYVASNEPVGSKSIVERHSFGVSAATIRNDMALLEDDDLIAQTHTSSGRVPTDKGYRLYVDTLAKLRPLSAQQRNAIERFLGESNDLDDVMARTVRLLSQLTNQVAVAQYPSLRRVAVRHIDLVTLSPERVLCVLILGNGVVEQQIALLPAEQATQAWISTLRSVIAREVIGLDIDSADARVATLLSTAPTWAEPGAVAVIQNILTVLSAQLRANRSDRIAVAGTANLTRPHDFNESLSAVFEAIEEQVTLLKLFAELVNDEREVAASIGSENAAYGLSGASVIAANYERDGQARLGVLGPMRMDYAGNIQAVRAVARYLHKLLGASQ